MFADMRWDAWELFGLAGEGLFFARLLVQWLASERERRPVVPAFYWYLSLAGALVLAVYALHLGSFAVLLPQGVGLAFYGRGLQLEYAARRRAERRRALGLDRPDYPWPALSVVVPVHNEEKEIGATLDNIVRQDYPGSPPEVIVALNGCVDASREAAARYPVRIVEDAGAGISFGKNLGFRAASGDMLVFVDADTRLPPGALRLLAEAAAGKTRYIGTVAGMPAGNGGVVRVCFAIANFVTRRRHAHAPGGVMLMDSETLSAIGGFDEKLPQGTSTDCIWRGMAAGADYIHVDSFKATTSIRRFEKKGVIKQMLEWRRTHQALAAGRRKAVEAKIYENIR